MQHIYYHITEIKLRIIYCVFSLICTIITSYLFQYELLYFITRPFLELQQKFIFVDLTEALYTIIRICIFISLMIIIPYIIYQFWSFFIPSCYFSERAFINKLLYIFFFLVILEICCIYFFLFPKICEFLYSFQFTPSRVENSLQLNSVSNKQISHFVEGFADKIKSRPSCLLIIELSARIESYVKLIIRLLIFILLFFQIPFLFVILYYNKYCNAYDLCVNRKLFFFIFILFSAFISPPDIISQLCLILLFLLLFEFLIFLGIIFDHKSST